MRQYLKFLTLAIATTVTHAQPILEWQAVFGGENDDRLLAAQPTGDGGYILGGYSSSGVSGNKTNINFGSQDYWVVKLNSNGVKQWEQGFGGTNMDVLKSLHSTADGGYILGGFSRSGISGNKTNPHMGTVNVDADYWVIKVNSNGNKQWEKVFGGNAEDIISTVVPAEGGGYILGGYSRSGVSGNKTSPNFGATNYMDYWVIKVDDNGNKLWEQAYGGIYDDALETMATTSDGGYILGGYSTSPVSGNKTNDAFGISDYWLVKIDADGNKQWDKVFGGTNVEELLSVQQTTDGGYILGGVSTSGISGNKTTPNFGGGDFWLIKTDSNGNKQWERTFGNTLPGNLTSEELHSVRQTRDGGYILGGHSEESLKSDTNVTGYGHDDYWLLKLDDNGSAQWEQHFGGSWRDEIAQVHLTSDGGYFLAGTSDSGMTGNKTSANFGLEGNNGDYWVIKLKPAPPILTALPFTNNTCTVKVSGLGSDLPIVIYAASNLLDWTPIFTNPPVNGSFVFVDPQPGFWSQRFYRAALMP